MEAHDLRIGNYVGRKYWNINPKTNLKTKEYQSCRIVSLGLDKILTTESLSRNKYIKSDYNLIEPIPLTEEWLKKISPSFIDLGNLILRIDRFKFIWKFSYKYWYVVDDISGVYISKIEFVHELQNLYHALTGEELTIKTI